MSQARFSVRTAVAEGFEFWRANVLRATGPLAVALVGLTLLLFGKTVPWILVGIALYALAGVLVQATLFRIALSDEGGAIASPGLFGIQWSMVETRLAIVALLTAVTLAFGLFSAGVALDVLGKALAFASAGSLAAPLDESLSALSPLARLVYGLAALALVSGLFVLNARLSMAAPTTIAEGRVRFLAALGASRGATVRMVAASFLALLPVIAGQFLASWYVGKTQNPNATAWSQLIVGIISTFFYVPISVGMTSYIYRRLKQGAHQ